MLVAASAEEALDADGDEEDATADPAASDVAVTTPEPVAIGEQRADSAEPMLKDAGPATSV